MKHELFAVFDAAAVRFLEIFCAPTLEFAIRGFKEACGTDGHQFSKFPEDYSLFHVGTFDAELGAIEPMTAHKIAVAASFVGELQGPGPVDLQLGRNGDEAVNGGLSV